MAKTLENKLIDVRTVSRYLDRDALSRADYEKHLEQLPDVASQGTPVTVRLEDGDEEKEESTSAS